MDLVLSMIRFSTSNARTAKKVYNYKANDVGVVYNEQMLNVFIGAC